MDSEHDFSARYRYPILLSGIIPITNKNDCFYLPVPVFMIRFADISVTESVFPILVMLYQYVCTCSHNFQRICYAMHALRGD